MQYYFSGLDRQAHVDLVRSEGGAIMVNPYVLPKSVDVTGLRYVVDSGVFVRPKCDHSYDPMYDWVELEGNPHYSDDYDFEPPRLHHHCVDDYIALCQRYPDALWYANADCVGDQQMSDDHFERLSADLPRTLWIFQAGSSLTWGQAEAHYHALLPDGSRGYGGLIGVGGIVPLLQSHQYRRVDRILSELSKVAKLHVFGLGSPRLIRQLRGIESVDGSTWLAGFRQRKIFTQDGTAVYCKKSGLAFTPDECARHNVRQFQTL